MKNTPFLTEEKVNCFTFLAIAILLFKSYQPPGSGTVQGAHILKQIRPLTRLTALEPGQFMDLTESRIKELMRLEDGSCVAALTGAGDTSDTNCITEY